MRKTAEADLLKLAIAIARRVLHRELTLDPESIEGLIRVALEKLESRELCRVRVHPDQEPAIRTLAGAFLSSQQVELIPDPSLQCGDVLFETAHGTLDASIEAQLQEIERGFADRLQPVNLMSTEVPDQDVLAPYLQDLEQLDLLPWCGKVTATVGLLIESQGPAVAIGDFCEIFTTKGHSIRTQVIGFRNGRVLAMPLEEPDGLQLGSRVIARVAGRPAGGWTGPARARAGRIRTAHGRRSADGSRATRIRCMLRPRILSSGNTSRNAWSPASAPSIVC